VFAKGNIALAEKFIAVAKRNVALAAKFVAFANCYVTLAEKLVAFVNCNVALAEKLVAFLNCNVALAEKLVAFCSDFLDAIDCTHCLIPQAKRRSVYGSGGLPSCAHGVGDGFDAFEAHRWHASQTA
jgi:hypothetical protein